MTTHDQAEAITTHNPFAGNRLGLDAPPVISAEQLDRTVVVSFADGHRTAFHHQWLRQCCYCPTCGDPADGIRFTTVISFTSSISPRSITVEHGDLVLT